ncbi:hypothetical protein ACGFIF_33415 [Kribbella sp. NPDC049174]|uniref:hypothetical protein n=1 Tax=Kribbella sp. NPDC049174 TaxID=3364112 RepID=UPI00371CC3E7
MTAFDIIPEQASHGQVVPDAELPMLAAHWLAAGYDSPLLRELAGLTRRQATEAGQMLDAVLAELGHPTVIVDDPFEQLPWRGYWHHIWWAIDQMDKTHIPYASAQRVLEVLGEVPDLWRPGRGAQLIALLRQWDAHPDQRIGVPSGSGNTSAPCVRPTYLP